MAKILIVDDEPRIRELIREHLQYAGYVCEEAGDGSAALSLLSGGGYDLVILDLMMPFMDGMTFSSVVYYSKTRVFQRLHANFTKISNCRIKIKSGLLGPFYKTNKAPFAFEEGDFLLWLKF